MTTRNLTFAGEVVINKMEIVSINTSFVVDLQNMFLGINVYEDIFAPFINGTLVIQDANALINKLPIVGEEFLDLDIVTPGFPDEDKKHSIHGRFYVYKVSDRQYTNDRLVSYILHFVSVEALLDMNIKLSKGFNASKISDIASDILKQYSYFQNDSKELTEEQLERFNIEETSNGHAYVSNFWSPVKNLNYLAEHAISMPANNNGTMTEGSPTFLFFENRNGLNFISLEALFRNDITREFRKDNFTRDIPTDKENRTTTFDFEKNYSRVLDFNVVESFSYIDRNRSGTFASNLIVHNITNKTYRNIAFDYKTNYDKEIRLNEFAPISKQSINTKENAYIMMEKANAIFEGNHDISNSKIAQRRLSLMNLMDTQQIEITVLGRTDYTVGQRVSFVLYKVCNLELEDEQEDKLLSGNYLITAIRHIITNQNHQCVMLLMKDSLSIDLNEVERAA
jgi:hypothetical protein